MAHCTHEMNDLLGTLYSNRAACSLEMEMLEDALIDADKCISLKPSWGRGYLRKSLVLLEMEDVPEANKVIEEGLQCDPDDEGLLALKNGEMTYEMSSNSPADNVIKEAVEMLKNAGECPATDKSSILSVKQPDRLYCICGRLVIIFSSLCVAAPGCV